MFPTRKTHVLPDVALRCQTSIYVAKNGGGWSRNVVARSLNVHSPVIRWRLLNNSSRWKTFPPYKPNCQQRRKEEWSHRPAYLTVNPVQGIEDEGAGNLWRPAICCMNTQLHHTTFNKSGNSVVVILKLKSSESKTLRHSLITSATFGANYISCGAFPEPGFQVLFKCPQ